MNETAAFSIKSWESFYVIVGSSAGALTGLQFVVLTMIAEARQARGGGGETIAAFGSPNVVHFCSALLVSAICSAPWAGLAPPGIAIAVCGACGVIYSGVVLRRTLRQDEYKPVLEDWTWHAALPTLAYAALVLGGWTLEHRSVGALYVVGGATLLLVFIGIHNAWDTVMYITVVGLPEHATKPRPPAAPREALPVPKALPPTGGHRPPGPPPPPPSVRR